MSEERYSRRNIYALGLTSLLTDVSSESVYAVLPLYMLNLGLGREVLGLVEGLGEFTSSIFKLISGVVSQKIGRYKALTAIGYSLSNFTKPLLAWCKTGLTIGSVKVLDRVGKGVRTSPRDTLIATSSTSNGRGRAFGIHRSMDTAGALLGPLIAFLLLPTLGYRGVFLFSLVPGTLAILTLLVFVKERSSRDTALKRADARLSFRFYLFLSTVCLIGLSGFHQSFLLVRTVELGWSEQNALILLVLSNTIYLSLAYIVGRVFDIYIRNQIYPLVFVLIAIGSTTVILFGTSYAPLIYFTNLGLFQAFNDVSTRVVTSRVVGRGKVGLGFGLMHSTLGLSSLAGYTIFGVLYEKFSYKTSFLYSTIMGLIGFTLALVFVKHGVEDLDR